jgi:ketosteroid isomerase-like protein
LVLVERDVDGAVELLTEDVVVEHPFGPAGVPERLEGREAFRAHLSGALAGSRNRFDGFEDLAVHQTVDPDVVVIECALSGVNAETGEAFSRRYVQVIRARGGKIAHWKDYVHVG